MGMAARALSEPAADRGRLVGRVVVENEVDGQVRGDGGLDRIQEAPEFHGAVPAVTLANDLAAHDLEARRRATSCRDGHSRGCGAPAGRGAWAAAAGSDRAPESATS